MEYATPEMEAAMMAPNAMNYGKAIGRLEWGQAMFLKIPDHMHRSLTQYILFGHLDGDFMAAIVEGNLFRSVRCADDTNLHAIRAYVSFFVNSAPADCYGSKEQVQRWVEVGGLNGLMIQDSVARL